MKKMKKMIALLIAAVMVVSMMSVTAFAAPASVDAGTYDKILTVTGTDAGDTLNFYKVIEWVDNATDNVKGWKATEKYATVLTKDVLTEVLLGTPATQADVDNGDATKVGEYINPTGITSELAGKLAKAAAADTAVQSSTSTTLDVSANANLGPGTYLVLITPNDINTVYNPVIVSSDFNTDNEGKVDAEKDKYTDAVAKKSDTELNKTAKTSEEIWADQKWSTTAIGDTVSFSVKTTIPAYGDTYERPFFAVHDKLKDLDLLANTVTVTDPAGLTKDTEYTVTPDGKSGYTLKFSEDYLKTIKTPTSVTITYDAIVSTTAPVHVNTEKNEVSTEFSHIPSSEDDHAFKKDTTQHYTFTLDAEGLGGTTEYQGKKTSEIVKIGQDENGNPITSEKHFSEITSSEYYQGPLAQAEFKLYTDAACEHEYIPKKADGTPDAALSLKSGSDGRFTIKGLDAGTYYLKETKAPAGYVKDSNAHTIEIAAKTEPATITEYTKDGKDWISKEAYDALPDKTGYKSYTYDTDVLSEYTVKIDGKATATYHFENKGTDAEIDWEEEPPVEKPFDIINTKGVELPSTGGIGTTMFYIVGAALVIGAGILLVTRRRMSAR